MTTDESARVAAIDPTRSFVVQAPAGSGKTELLIQRYLALLARVEAPEEIVALTFTRKAAEEMRARVLGALATAFGEQAMSAHDRKTQALAQAAAERAQARGWFLADCPGRLRIQTFDALCAQLVNQWPAAAGAGVSFSVTETPLDLYAEAAWGTFGQIEQAGSVGAALADLLPALGNDIDKFVSLVGALLERREQWLPILLGSVGHDPDQSRLRLEAAFVHQALDAMARAQEFCPDGVLIAACSYMEAQTGDSQWHAAALRGGGEAALRLWQQLADGLLTAKGEFRKRFTGWPKTLGPMTDFRAQLEGLPDLAQALADARAWGPCVYGEDQWRRLSALIRILPAASAELLLVFARHEQWDFTEVALRALQALGSESEPTDAALRFDSRLHHLLVDEFQDTSVLQYRLLERLTAEWTYGDDRSLFVVGDPMQSIYAFRKAEVGLFLRLATDGLGAWSLEPLTLTANFRSHSELVDWANTGFGTIFPRHFEADTGAVPHVAATPARGPGGAARMHALQDVDLATEAEYVAQLVRDVRAEDAHARVAILVRSRRHGHAIAEACHRAGLRFSAVDLYSLTARPVILDLLALTETLLLPGARLSALSCLRAPWCGLELADILALCEGDQRPILDLLEDETRTALLSPTGQLRAQRLREVLAHADIGRVRVALATRVEQAWLALKGPATLDSEGDLLEAEVFFRTLADLERAAEVDLWSLRERLDGLYAPPDPHADDLQILTIHKAKGLEFDVVICPCLGRKTGSDQRPLLLALEATIREEPDFLLAPLKADGEDADALYDCLWGMSARKRQHELGRLLYVACTRARTALHLVGHCKRKGDDWRPQALLGVLWPVVAPAFENPIKDPGRSLSPALVDQGGLRRLRSEPLLGVTDALPTVWVPAEEPPENLVFDWAGACIRVVGVVVHALFAQLAHQELPLAGPVPEALKARAGSLLRGHGLHGPEWEEAQRHVVAALERTLSDARGRWILQAHTDAQSERGLSGLVDGELLAVRIDRSFVDSDGVRWIIDYKTSRHEGSDKESFLNQEQARYTRQLTTYAHLFTQLDPRPVELALYFPLLTEFRHWRYQGLQTPG
ncbi:MAG TPA: UvrD-helicase domain-containing protein [Acidiferrobacter sp.]|nr:UvrD-helicase domain-containing protein [Acidiferrobacter sp.]